MTSIRPQNGPLLIAYYKPVVGSVDHWCLLRSGWFRIVMLLGRARPICCALLCSLVLLVTVSSASWIPNESAAAAAEYQNRGPSATAYELTLGDLLPEHLLREDQSLNFVNKHFRLVL